MKNKIFQHQYHKQVKMYIYLFLFHNWLPLEFVFTYNISLLCRMWWEINICTRVDKKKIKSSRKECHKNIFQILINKNHCAMSQEHFSNFDQWKTFSKNLGFDYGLFTNSLRIIVPCNFLLSSFKLKCGILPLLTK